LQIEYSIENIQSLQDSENIPIQFFATKCTNITTKVTGDKMVQIRDFEQLEKHLFEVPASFRKDMRVPARFYADEELLKGVVTDNSLQQLINTATLPGIVKYALAMPDIHQGYGFPIGGVVATELPDGIISPGGVGYDINCGVRLLATHLNQEEVRPYLDDLATILYSNCPSGVGKGGNIKIKAGELDQVLTAGAKWAVKRGYGSETDLERTEENGCLAGADPGRVKSRYKFIAARAVWGIRFAAITLNGFKK
jgi:tRNA-splicing ligase RtcB